MTEQGKWKMTVTDAGSHEQPLTATTTALDVEDLDRLVASRGDLPSLSAVSIPPPPPSDDCNDAIGDNELDALIFSRGAATSASVASLPPPPPPELEPSPAPPAPPSSQPTANQDDDLPGPPPAEFEDHDDTWDEEEVESGAKPALLRTFTAEAGSGVGGETYLEQLGAVFEHYVEEKATVSAMMVNCVSRNDIKVLLSRRRYSKALRLLVQGILNPNLSTPQWNLIMAERIPALDRGERALLRDVPDVNDLFKAPANLPLEWQSNTNLTKDQQAIRKARYLELLGQLMESKAARLLAGRRSTETKESAVSAASNTEYCLQRGHKRSVPTTGLKDNDTETDVNAAARVLWMETGVTVTDLRILVPLLRSTASEPKHRRDVIRVKNSKNVYSDEVLFLIQVDPLSALAQRPRWSVSADHSRLNASVEWVELSLAAQRLPKLKIFQEALDRARDRYFG